jgi:hypothetical protein
VGLSKLRVVGQNQPAGSAPHRANRARDKVTQRMAGNWRYLGPHRGDPTSSSFLSESQLGSFHHTPLRGLASSRPGSSNRYDPGTKWETTRPGLALEEHLPLLALIERYIYPCYLSPSNGDPSSTQILTGVAVPVSNF